MFSSVLATVTVMSDCVSSDHSHAMGICPSSAVRPSSVRPSAVPPLSVSQLSPNMLGDLKFQSLLAPGHVQQAEMPDNSSVDHVRLSFFPFGSWPLCFLSFRIMAALLSFLSDHIRFAFFPFRDHVRFAFFPFGSWPLCFLSFRITAASLSFLSGYVLFPFFRFREKLKMELNYLKCKVLGVPQVE